MTQWLRRVFNALIESVDLRYGTFPTSADAVAAAAITIAAAAVAWTFGAWTQIVAAVGVTVDTQIWGCTLENFVGAVAQGEVEIARGGVGAEVMLVKVPIVGAVYTFPKPVFVPVGTRISARYRTSTGVADTVDVKLLTTTGF